MKKNNYALLVGSGGSVGVGWFSGDKRDLFRYHLVLDVWTSWLETYNAKWKDFGMLFILFIIIVTNHQERLHLFLGAANNNVA